jgi:hypothetical protein
VDLGELDWMVCNGGADIWQLLPAREGKGATWVADEQWDAHISFRRAWKLPPPFTSPSRWKLCMHAALSLAHV